MRRRSRRIGNMSAVFCAACALWATGAAGEPGSGPHGTVDQTFTMTRPSTPTGVGFEGRFHAPGDEQGKPPFMRRMVIHPPPGMRYDTSVPDQCTANDLELAFRGPEACPAGSLLGEGTTEGEVLMPFADDVVLDHFVHRIYVLNNANEQIILVESEGYTVVRGKFRPDGALDYELPTCFPKFPGADCVDEWVLSFGTSNFLPPYTETSGGAVQSYATTPPECPRTGRWSTTIEFTWSDGSFDSMVTTQPCSRKKRA